MIPRPPDRSGTAFHYRIAWRPTRPIPGEHAGARSGDNGTSRGEQLLQDAQQARRLAVRASLLDPLERLWVRDHLQRSRIDLWVLADLSGSMGVAPAHGSAVAAQLLQAVATSAWQQGDRFGALAADGQLQRDLALPLGRHLGLARQMAERWSQWPRTASPTRRSAAGLFEAGRQLGNRRALVFVVSDFLGPLDDWRRLLEQLRLHEVVPIVVDNPTVEGRLPRWGLVQLQDAETGALRTVWMRPGLIERWTREARERQDALRALFRRAHARPLTLSLPVQGQALTRHFHGG